MIAPLLVVLRLAAGPLALAGFFLPWARGPGVLSANEFTGYRLVGFADRLQQLDLTPLEGGGLWLLRAGILGVAVAATWQTLLAPAHRWHFAYAASGWYLVAAALGALALGAYRHGIALPPAGLLLLAASAACFGVVTASEHVRRPA